MSKRILITGQGSYIGNMFCEYTTEYYDVDTIDVCTDKWKEADFSSYDAVVHVAAIVHKQEREFTDEEYYKVNTDLAVEVADKAKCDGVSQFVFLSTMSVYGVLNGVIDKDTPLKPFNTYGKSKLKAESMLRNLSDESFCVTILRPPMVYGKGCKGNYNGLVDFAKKAPLFADYKSQRSMIFIDNLCEFIRKCIDEKLCGTFCPQDECYIKTSQMVKLVAQLNGKNIRLTKIFNPFITLALKMKFNTITKVFGSLVYESDLCPPYKRVDFETAIRKTEEK